MGAMRVEKDMLGYILEITEALRGAGIPLADRLSVIDRADAGRISGFLNCYKGGRYVLPGKEPPYLNGEAAAEVTHAAFVAAFGRGPFGRYDLEKSKGEILAVLTYLDSWLPKKKKLLERAERFFGVWREAAMEKTLPPLLEKEAPAREAAHA